MSNRLILFGSESGISALRGPLQRACPNGWTLYEVALEVNNLLELAHLVDADSILCFATEDVLWSQDLDRCKRAMDCVWRVKSVSGCGVMAFRISREFQGAFTAANGAVDAYASIRLPRAELRELIVRLGGLG